MQINPPVFGSKKASMAALGAALITFIMTVLPVVFPDVSPDIWKELSALLTQILSFYLVGQSIADVAASKYQSLDGQSQLDIAPE